MPLPLLQQHSFWRDRRRSVWRLPNNRKEVTRRDMASKKRSWFFLYGNRDLAAACRLLSLPLESTPDLKLPLRQHLARTAKGKEGLLVAMCQPRPYFFPEPVQSSRKCRKPFSPSSGMCMCTVKQAAPPGGFLKVSCSLLEAFLFQGTSAFDTVFSRNFPFLCQSSLFSYDNRWAHVSRHARGGGWMSGESALFVFSPTPFPPRSSPRG